MRKKRLISLFFLMSVIMIVGIAILAQAPTTPLQHSAPEESPAQQPPSGEEIPPNLLIIPEVPVGTLAIMLACFFAFLISQMKPRFRVR